MNPIIDALNWLSDQDWGWWPLLKYRPPKDEVISNALVLKLTPVFGTLSGLVVAAIAQHLKSIPYLLLDILIGWVAYIVIYRASFVPAWNSRALSMKRKNA